MIGSGHSVNKGHWHYWKFSVPFGLETLAIRIVSTTAGRALLVSGQFITPI
jgi:hypothetical protein